jgi:hypothetical protein
MRCNFVKMVIHAPLVNLVNLVHLAPLQSLAHRLCLSHSRRICRVSLCLHYSEQLYDHLSDLQILSHYVTKSNSEAVTENLHTHFSGWTIAVRQSIENLYEGLLSKHSARYW